MPAAALQRPVLKFTDCKSRREIVLVGVMHNNPASIALVESVVRDYAAREALGAVAIESCESRWERMQQFQPPGSWLRRALDNEFQAAAELAEEVGCGLALADEAIEVTGARLAQLFKATLVDLASPLDGGWRRIGRDIRGGWAALQPQDGVDGVGTDEFFSGDLLVGAPVAWLRYFVGSPVLALLLLGIAAVLSLAAGVTPRDLADLASGTADAPPLSADELAPSVVVALIESVVLLRVLLVGLIEERNFVLARHIRAASMQVLTPPRALRQRGPGRCELVERLTI